MKIRAYFPHAKRGNNTQLIIAQQRGGHGRVCQRSVPLRLLRSCSATRGPTEEAGQGLSRHKPTLRFVYGERSGEGGGGGELMAADFYWSICQKDFTHKSDGRQDKEFSQARTKGDMQHRTQPDENDFYLAMQTAC